MENNLVEVRKVNLTYNKEKHNAFQALHDVNLNIQEGEFAIIFGPSGCGKTSLINIISGLESPDNGEVVFGKENISRLDSSKKVKFYRTRIGMIFQAYNLIPTLTVNDNVALPQIFISQKKEERDRKIAEILRKLGIEEHGNKIPTELSGGQQQRIGIARAIINNPPLLLADEPIGNLDSASANNVMQILKNLNKNEGKTIVMVSHNPENIIWGNHIIYMKDGKIIKEERKTQPGKIEEIGKREFEEMSRFESILNNFRGLSEQEVGMLMNPMEAKLMVEALLIPYNDVQIKYFEEAIRMRLTGSIKTKGLLDKLDAPNEKTGVGLDARTARKYAKNIEEIIETARIVFNKENKSIALRTNAIMKYLSKNEELKLGDKTKKLRALIQKRLLKKIDHKEFQSLLNLSNKLGGAGFDRRTVRKILRHISLILIIGYGLSPKRVGVPAVKNREVKLPVK